MTPPFKDKNIVLGVTGSIAAYKACDLAREFMRKGASVTVVMTPEAKHFVTPITFQALTHNPVHHDPSFSHTPSGMDHIELAKKADLFLIAPATAHTIAKLAHGLADDLISILALTMRSAVAVVPAMNTNMYHHAAVQANMKKIQDLGYKLIHPDQGELACGDIGEGHIADLDTIIKSAESLI